MFINNRKISLGFYVKTYSNSNEKEKKNTILLVESKQILSARVRLLCSIAIVFCASCVLIFIAIVIRDAKILICLCKSGGDGGVNSGRNQYVYCISYSSQALSSFISLPIQNSHRIRLSFKMN